MHKPTKVLIKLVNASQKSDKANELLQDLNKTVDEMPIFINGLTFSNEFPTLIGALSFLLLSITVGRYRARNITMYPLLTDRKWSYMLTFRVIKRSNPTFNARVRSKLQYFFSQLNKSLTIRRFRS